VYQSLSVDEQKNTLVYCSNYGKASAIEYYSKKYPLPKVICSHNSYWYWWPNSNDFSTIIIIGGQIENHLQALENVVQSGFHKTPNAMPYENNLDIFIGRGFKVSLDKIRKINKLFI